MELGLNVEIGSLINDAMGENEFGDIIADILPGLEGTDTPYVVVEDPSKEGGRLLVWYSLSSLRPVTRQTDSAAGL